MVHIYEKTCKTTNNEYGIVKIQDENVFKRPCIITIIAGPIFLKNINGSLRQVANLVNPDIDNNYDNFRRILGLGFGDYKEEYGRFTRITPTEEELEEFMQKYFYPLIEKNNEKLDVFESMKNMRNITFVTYCNGALVFKKIENKLEQKMSSLGYTSSEIGLILSQICLAAISGDVIKRRGTKALAITFGDVLDLDFEKNKNIFSSNQNIVDRGYISYGDSIGFGIIGDGEHSFKKHMTENPILSEKIKIFLNTSLDNAIYNQEEDIIEPLTYEKMEIAFQNYNNKIHKK